MADFVEGEDMTLKKNHPAGYNGITDGVIWQQLLLFFFPILFGTFFQQLYNTVDAVIVGRFVGKEALSCVSGSSGQIINLVVGFFTGLSAGATVMISQHFGAKNEEQLHKALHTAYAFAITGGIIAGVIGVVMTRMVLKWMNTPENLLPDDTLCADLFCGTLIYFCLQYGSGNLTGNRRFETSALFSDHLLHRQYYSGSGAGAWI